MQTQTKELMNPTMALVFGQSGISSQGRTKIEGTLNGNRFIVRRISIDSGKVLRVLLDAKAASRRDAENQLIGALQFFKESNQ